jgi:hypothetical protein
MFENLTSDSVDRQVKRGKTSYFSKEHVSSNAIFDTLFIQILITVLVITVKPVSTVTCIQRDHGHSGHFKTFPSILTCN